MEEINEPILEHYETLETSEFVPVNPKIKINCIEFEGIKRTDKQFLMNTLGSCGMEGSSNLKELSDSLGKAFNKLERLNIFKDVSVTIDQDDTTATTTEKDDSKPITAEVVHKVKVIFNCKEKRLNIKTGTELQRKDIAWVKHILTNDKAILNILFAFCRISVVNFLIFLEGLKV